MFVDFTEDQLLKLDGITDSSDAMAKIARIKEERQLRLVLGTDHIGVFLSVLVNEALTIGELDQVRTFKSETGCMQCGVQPKDVLFKSGPRKGLVKETMPVEKYRTRSGVSVCRECWSAARIRLTTYLQTVKPKFEWNEVWTPCPYVKSRKVSCKKCGWNGHQHEMLMIFNGWRRYRGQCARCDGRIEFLLDELSVDYGDWMIVEKANDE